MKKTALLLAVITSLCAFTGCSNKRGGKPKKESSVTTISISENHSSKLSHRNDRGAFQGI